MGCGSFVRNPGGHERHTWSRRGELPVMPWAGLEGPAFAASLGHRSPHQGHGRFRTAELPRLRRPRTGGDPMTSAFAESDPARLAIARLNALAVELDRSGFLTCVFHEGGTLKLQVTNRAVPSCRETLAVAPDGDGAWWFWWSWADRITLADDIAAAAFKVAYVLTPQAG
jgi:hypothetical protein